MEGSGFDTGEAFCRLSMEVTSVRQIPEGATVLTAEMVWLPEKKDPVSFSVTHSLAHLFAQLLGKCLWSLYSLAGTVLSMGAEPKGANSGFEMLTAKMEMQI